MLRSLSTRNIAHLTFRRRRVFLLTLLVPPLLAAIVLLPKKVQYESTAAVMVKIGEQEVAAPDMISEQQRQSALAAPSMVKQIMASELHIMTSSDVAKLALQRTGLERVYPGVQQRADKAKIPVLDLAVEMLQKDLSIAATGETNLLTLSAFNTDPVVARELLTAVLQASMEKQASVMRDPRKEFLDRKIASLRTEAEAAKRKLSDFKRERQITAFDEERTLLLRQRDNIELNLSQSRAQMVAAQGRGSALAHSLTGTPDEIALSDENDRAQKMLEQAQARLTTARARYESAQRRFTSNNPELADLAVEVESAKQDLQQVGQQSMARVRKGVNPLAQQLSGGLSVARSDANAYRNTVAELERQLDAINKRVAFLDTSETELRDLESRQGLAETTYRSYLQRAQSAEILGDMNDAGISGLSIVEQPTLPYRAARPRKFLLLGLSMVAGLLAAFGVCLLLETLDQTIGFPEQLEEALGVPVLATITLKKSG
jgi:polysaccharide biosynthesis protein PslE